MPRCMTAQLQFGGVALIWHTGLRMFWRCWPCILGSCYWVQQRDELSDMSESVLLPTVASKFCQTGELDIFSGRDTFLDWTFVWLWISFFKPGRLSLNLAFPWLGEKTRDFRSRHWSCAWAAIWLLWCDHLWFLICNAIYHVAYSRSDSVK